MEQNNELKERFDRMTDMLRLIIKDRINYKKLTREEYKNKYGKDSSFEEQLIKYDGFDMSGFNNSQYHNMELISRFEDLMCLISKEEIKNKNFIYPVFWKGGCNLWEFDVDGNHKNLIELTGDTTENIILEIILRQNMSMIKNKY